MSGRFIGVDRSGEPNHPTDHLYYVATRYSSRGKQKRWVVRLTRQTVEKLRKEVAEWQEKVAAVMTFKVVNEVFHPGYSIQIDKDFQGERLKKVRRYLKRLFGVVNYGRAYWADPPFEFLPKVFSEFIRDADTKALQARRKRIRPDETDPNIEKLLDILEKARRNKVV